jgi:hypothetical protein
MFLVKFINFFLRMTLPAGQKRMYDLFIEHIDDVEGACDYDGKCKVSFSLGNDVVSIDLNPHSGYITVSPDGACTSQSGETLEFRNCKRLFNMILNYRRAYWNSSEALYFDNADKKIAIFLTNHQD